MTQIRLFDQAATIDRLTEGEIPWPLVVSKHSLSNDGKMQPDWVAAPSLEHYAIPFGKKANKVGYLTPDANPDDFPPWILPYVRVAARTGLRQWVPSPRNNDLVFSIQGNNVGKFIEGTDPSTFPPSILPYIRILRDRGLDRFG